MGTSNWGEYQNKINVVGAWMSSSEFNGRAGAWVLIRDAMGHFLAARAVHLGSMRSALCAEAGAWHVALEFAECLGLNDIHFVWLNF